jgi:hypothetical protein
MSTEHRRLRRGREVIDLGDHVQATRHITMALRRICAHPECDRLGEWIICGPKVLSGALPDVCTDHLEYGREIGKR